MRDDSLFLPVSCGYEEKVLFLLEHSHIYISFVFVCHSHRFVIFDIGAFIPISHLCFVLQSKICDCDL